MVVCISRRQKVEGAHLSKGSRNSPKLRVGMYTELNLYIVGDSLSICKTVILLVP
jgi:hypothetical protein